MKYWLIALGATISGAALAVTGLLYGVITVGVPNQDPTPAQTAAEKAHLAIVDWILGAGSALLLLGLLMLLLRMIVRRLFKVPES